MKTSILILALAFTSPALAQDSNALGNWTGLGVQGSESWDMVVDIVPGGARIDYPGLTCGGVWIFDTTAPGIKGTEWLTYGKDQCLDGLGMTLSRRGDMLLVRWYDDVGGEIAQAELSKEVRSSSGKKSSGG
jgi:hypothetical protein